MKKRIQKMMLLILAAILLPGVMCACSDDAPEPMEDPAPAVDVRTLPLSDFTGNQLTVNNLQNGYYTLEFYAKGEGIGYVEAGSKRTALTYSPNILQKGVVTGIEVTDGTCHVAVHDVDMNRFLTMKLIKTDGPFNLLKGGDISMLTYAEQNGATYYRDSSAEDCLEILKWGGMNLVRLRLYNEPGKYEYGGHSLEPGIEDEDDILSLARRAKNAGMQILLTFHYSDYWTNGGEQYIPHAWEEMNAEQMTQALHDFTYSFMEKMKAQGTVPEYVSLGNETQAGMLYPMGGPLDSADPDYRTKVKNLAGFYNAGYQAVKESSPESKVIIHLADAGNKDANNWYFGLMNDNAVNYDIIGASYYPFWTSRDAKTVCEWAEYVTDKFDKDLIFMEVGYAWQQKIHDGVTDGQLSHNWPYTDLSQQGQKNFLLELTNEIKKVSNHRLLGYVYWDPIFIPAGSAGWAVGEVNAVSNSTLFDFQGNVLPAFDAMRFNN